MRSIEDIRDTGAAWVTEPELAMLCAFAKRAEAAEAKLRMKEADYRVLEDEVCDFESRLAKVVEICENVRTKSDDAGMITLAITLLAAAKGEE